MSNAIQKEVSAQRADGTGAMSLIRKLAEVMGEVERVKKTGHNAFHKYDYATEADIVAAVRSGMADRALMLVPNVKHMEVTKIPRKQGGDDRLVTLTVCFTVHDGESGEEMAFDAIGEGQDAGDKATYKAMTGATKYALLKLFLIPTGDDPENDDAPSKPVKGVAGLKAELHSRNLEPKTSNTPSRAQPPPVAQVVRFGKWKGRSIAELTRQELEAARDFARAEIAKAKPSEKWLPDLIANVAEVENRISAHEAAAKLPISHPDAQPPEGV